MTLVTYNIRYGGIGREHAIGSLIGGTQCHAAILQEATDPAAVERIARTAGMAVWAARRGHSLAVVSRVPLERCEWRWTSQARHAFLDLEIRGAPARIIGVHLRAVHSSWTERRRIRDVDALLRSLSQTGIASVPHVLAGDFNTLAPDERLDIRRLPWRLRPFIWLSGGAVQWRVVQRLGAEGYRDAYRALNPGHDGFTFPAWDPHIRLDYVFVPDALDGLLTRCDVIDTDEARRASDHLPIAATIG